MVKKFHFMVVIFAVLMLFACENQSLADFEIDSPNTEAVLSDVAKATTPASGAYSPVDQANWSSQTFALGANFNGTTVEFAVYSKNATRVLLEIYTAKSGVDAAYEYVMVKNVTEGKHIWRAKVASVPAGTLYGFRVWGPNWTYSTSWSRGNSSAGFISDCDANGNRFNPNKVLFDPYAKEISHDKSNPTVLNGGENHPNGGMFGTGAATYNGTARRNFDTGRWAPKAVVVKDTTSTGTKPAIAQKDAIIYEAHVRGISNHPSVANLNTILNTVGITASAIPASYRGTYKGVTYLIPYFKSLGINTIEFLPVHESGENDENPSNKPGGNYWGYMTHGFFAPERRYSSDQSMGGPTKEFKAMVKAFHDAGIEVYLDVVFNHTGEGGIWDEAGTTAELTFLRGFDNSEYYALCPDKKFYWESTGCGNNLRCDNEPVRKFILDSLTYWIDTMGVDGFRFDLAPVLGRVKVGDNWQFQQNAQTIVDIANLGVSKNIKMIAEAWDCEWPGGYQVGQFPNNWGEWNGRYRDAARKFIKGDSGINIVQYIHGDYDNFNDQGGPHKSVNFIVAHDGFTLTDLVSYDSKNNGGDWPFGPSDGGGDGNESWSHSGNQALRRQQLRNFYVLQMFSRGVPMIVWGDEFGRTQNGNNNPYNVDSVATWSNYNQINTDSPNAVATGGGGTYHNNLGTDNNSDGKNNLFLFARNVMNLRKDDATLRTANYTTTSYSYGNYNSGDKTISVKISGTNNYMWYINSGTGTYSITLPAAASGKKWLRIIDTQEYFENAGNDGKDNFWADSEAAAFNGGTGYGVSARSMVVFKEGTVTTSTGPATFSSIIPANNATDIGIGDDIVIKFSGNLDTSVKGTIKLDLVATSTSTVTISSSKISVSGNTITIANPALTANRKYENIVISGFKDTNGNDVSYSNASYTFNTGMNFKSITPITGSTGIDPTAQIKIVFDSTIASQKGTVKIGNVTFSGDDIVGTGSSTITIAPGTKLNGGTKYTGITVSGFIGNNTSAGIGATIYHNDTTYNFTTSGTASTTTTTIAGVTPNAPIFSKAGVSKGTYIIKSNSTSTNITSSTSGASIYYTLDGTDPTSSSTRVLLSGSSLALTPTGGSYGKGGYKIKAVAYNGKYSSVSEERYLIVSTSSPTININGSDVMLQAFNWESAKNITKWYVTLKENASEIQNFNWVWMPPPTDSSAAEGYMPRKLFTFANSYGTLTQHKSAVTAIKGGANNTKLIADIVVNHRVGDSSVFDSFTNPVWNKDQIVPQNEWGGAGSGWNDTGAQFSSARDIDHTDPLVQKDILDLLDKLQNIAGTGIGYDGWRYDYVKGYTGEYIGYYNAMSNASFSVGELWEDGAPQDNLNSWVTKTGSGGTKSMIFDFSLKNDMNTIFGWYDTSKTVAGSNNLSGLKRTDATKQTGYVGWAPENSVTFVDNHDTGSTQKHWALNGDKVYLAYVYTLTQSGIPCVFWDHYFDWNDASNTSKIGSGKTMQNHIKELINIRRAAGVTNKSTVVTQTSSSNVYSAKVGDNLYVKIGSGTWSPSSVSGWSIYSGNNFAVWYNAPSTTTTTVANAAFKSIVPATNAKDVDITEDLIIKFTSTLDPNIKGTVTLDLMATSTTTNTYSGSNITISGDTITVSHAKFTTNRRYANLVISGFKDANGNDINYSNANYTFNTGTNFKSTIPATGETGVDPTALIKIVFDTAFTTSTKGTVKIGNVTFSGTDITSLTSSTITINPGTKLASGTKYTGITVSGFIASSTSPGVGATISYSDASYTFTTSGSASGTTTTTTTIASGSATFSSITPVNNAKDIDIGDSIVIKFSKNLDTSVKGSVKLNLVATSTSTVTFSASKISVSGNSITITNPALTANRKYENIDISGFKDISGNDVSYSNASYTFNTGMNFKSITPVTGATGIDPTAQIKIVFDSTIASQKGTVKIGNVTFSGDDIVGLGSSTITIDPGTKLASGTKYTGITVSGFIGNNTSAGIGATIYHSDTTYNFTTSGTASGTTTTTIASGVSFSSITPANSAKDVSLSENLVIKFSSNLDTSTMGTVKLTLMGGSKGNTPSVIAFPVSKVTISGNTITVSNPALTANRRYVSIDVSGFKGTNGAAVNYTNNNYSFNTCMNFKSITPATGSTAIDRTAQIKIVFDSTIASSTIGTVKIGNVTFSGSDIASVGSSTITINPGTKLAANTTYTGIMVSGFIGNDDAVTQSGTGAGVGATIYHNDAAYSFKTQ